MPLHPPSAYPAGPVMTRLWCHSAPLDKSRYGFRTAPSKHKPQAVPVRLLSSYSSKAPILLQRSTKLHLGFPVTDVITQVRLLPSRCLLLLVTLLFLLSQPVMSNPWSKVNVDYVVFRSKICLPPSHTDLVKQLGSHSDRMSSHFVNSKRNFGSAIEDSGHSGYQADEALIGLAVDSADFVEGGGEWVPDSGVLVDEREEDIYTESGMIEEIDGREFVERRRIVSAKKIPNKRAPKRLRKVIDYRKTTRVVENEDAGYLSDSKRQSPISDSYSYMRRRRRSTLDDTQPSYQSPNQDWENPSIDQDSDRNQHINDYDDDEIDDETDSKDKKSTDSIQLRLFLRGKDKKTRKLLKKKLRQKSRNLMKPPPWECKLIPIHKRMRKGIFPEIVLDGRCETDKCFYRLYNCDEIHYVLKLLERDPDKCNPLPSISNTTIYEERWNLRPYKVTVGCSCASPNVKANLSKSKSKNRQRGQF